MIKVFHKKKHQPITPNPPSMNQRIQAHINQEDPNYLLELPFGLMGDGSWIFFDKYGHFFLRFDPPNNLYLEDPDGVREEIYLEPAWLHGHLDIMNYTMEQIYTDLLNHH